MDTKHTPLPYAVKKGLHGNPDGVTIWQEKLPGMVGAKGIAKMSMVHAQAEVEATAAFIVRACNAHDQLVHALQMIRDADDDAGSDGLPRIPAIARHAIDAALAAAGAA